MALAREEPAAAEVEIILRRGGSRVSAVNLAEAVDQLGRVHGHSPHQLREVFEPLFAGTVEVMDVTESSAWHAADFRRAHCRRRISELSLADCFVLAAAQAGDVIVTADPPLARAAETEGLEVVGVPDSRGRRP